MEYRDRALLQNPAGAALATAPARRPGVCYIGLVYKNLPNDPNDHVCCAAQMFLSEGDGVVFRGANGPWKTDDYEYHLEPGRLRTTCSAKCSETYAQKHNGPPKELFIHGRTTFDEDEWARLRKGGAGRDQRGRRFGSRPTNGETKIIP